MKHKLLATYAALALAIASTAAMAQDHVAGVYRGTITSSGEAAKGATTLGVRNGRIIGAYHFKGLSGTERGTLSRCRLTKQQLYCIWKDSYGRGDFVVRFTDDFRSFDGYWFTTVGQFKSTGLSGGNRWNGKR